MNWVTVAAPKLWPEKIIFPGVCTSIFEAKTERGVEEELRFVSGVSLSNANKLE